MTPSKQCHMGFHKKEHMSIRLQDSWRIKFVAMFQLVTLQVVEDMLRWMWWHVQWMGFKLMQCIGCICVHMYVRSCITLLFIHLSSCSCLSNVVTGT
jgi:hypothetical protein